MAIHSSNSAWQIPWAEERDGVQSMITKSRTQLSLHTKKKKLDEI